MAKYTIEDSTLTGIADAIRGKEGSSAAIPVSSFASRIGAIAVTSSHDSAGNVTLKLPGSTVTYSNGDVAID